MRWNIEETKGEMNDKKGVWNARGKFVNNDPCPAGTEKERQSQTP
jgi:hypothetical protein